MESMAVGAAFVAFMRANQNVNQVEIPDLPTNPAENQERNSASD